MNYEYDTLLNLELYIYYNLSSLDLIYVLLNNTDLFNYINKLLHKPYNNVHLF